MNNNYLLKSSIFKIGKVISVDGRTIKIEVDKLKNTSTILYKGELLKNVSVGSYLKIVKGFTKIICKVEGEYIKESKIYNSKDYKSLNEQNKRVLLVSLLGFFDKKIFKRGIKELPLIDNIAFLLTKEEFSEVHNFIKGNDEALKIGVLSLEKGQNIEIGINKLFASHIGIFGNTGSGKSYTLAKIYRELFKKYKNNGRFQNNAQFLLIDFNGEYSGEKVITENKKVYNLSTKEENAKIQNKLPIGENVLLTSEILSILASATDKTQKPFIDRTLKLYKKIQKSKNPLEHFQNSIRKKIEDILLMTNKDKAYTLKDYISLILNYEQESFSNEFKWHNVHKYFKLRESLSSDSRPRPNYEILINEVRDSKFYESVKNYKTPNNILSKFIHYMYLQLVYDIYNEKAQNDHIAPAINKLKGQISNIEKIFDTTSQKNNLFSENNFIVLNLLNVNTSMKKILPLLISKQIYDKKKSNSNKYKYLNIIIDEAHNILSHSSQRESETWKDYRLETFEEIIKEGRKFGVFLTIASQRPSDISPTIVSQVHNYFLHRLINNRDIEAVEKTISYLDKISFEYLPIIPTGSCIFAGIAANIPTVIDINKIDNGYEPKNETIDLVREWEDYDTPF